MRWLLLSLLLLWPLSVQAGVLRICSPGDTQEGVLCEGHVDAWTHQKAAIDWIAANPEMCDVVIFPGDLVDGHGWDNDCSCMAQEAVDCTTLTSVGTGEACGVGECNSASAAACAEGTAGYYCEYTRVQTLLDTLQGTVPYIVVPGNHDTDTKGVLAPRCERSFVDYNSYFVAGRLSAGFIETGTHTESWPCPSLDTGVAEQGIASYHVLTAADAQWLFIALPWFPIHSENDADAPYSGMTPATLAWAKDVIEAHLGMPTILIAHHMLANDCADSDWPDYEDTWCQNLSGDWSAYWTGMPVYTYLMSYPQVFMTFGGHDRELYQTVSANTTHRVMGVVVDYTDNITGAPAWQLEDNNGGGGVVQMLRVNAVDGLVSSKAYSPEEDDWIAVYGDEGSHWSVQMLLCGDDVRFDFPTAACPARVFTPSIDLGNIRKR